MGKVQAKPRKTRTRKVKRPNLPTLLSAADAADHLGIDPDTFRLRYLGTVFTRFAVETGHARVYLDEVSLYLDTHEGEPRATAIVLEHRRRMGRLAGSR